MLIVDMPMPSRCGACKCRHIEFDIDRVAVFCAIMDNLFVEHPDSIPSWCPIKGEISEIELMHLGEERAFAARNIAAERKDDADDR